MNSIYIDVTRETLSIEKYLSETVASAHGAQIVFLGKVRNHNEGQGVTGVTYDGFEPLIHQVFREICEEAQTQWGRDLSLQLAHRLGTLAIGDISVIIVVSSRHRDASYQASRYVIEQIKIRVPIWKKEHYLSGQSDWLEGRSLNET